MNHHEVNDVERTDTNEIFWLLNSGCTDHIVNDDNIFDRTIVSKDPIDVNMPDGKNLKATKLGNMKVWLRTYYSENEVLLKDVYFVEGMSRNLLSVPTMTNVCPIVARDDSANIYQDR